MSINFHTAELAAVTTTNGTPQAQKPPRTRPQPSSSSSSSWKIIAAAVLFGILFLAAILAGVVPAIITQNRLQDTSGGITLGANGTVNCNCKDGLPGAPGMQGPQGISGATGAQGRQGDPGQPGIAICLPNPDCASGPSGPSGPSGTSGARGQTGFAGANGATGAAGPTGGTGPSGPTGATGATGATGPSGFNGTCDCFDLPNATIGNTVVTGTLDVKGNITCSNTTIFGSSCFPFACLNFSACDLQARSLILRGGAPTSLLVDGGITTVVQFGSNSTPAGLFQTYTQTTSLISSIYTLIQSAGDMLFRVQGTLSNILSIASTGLVNIAAQSGVNIETLGIGDVTLRTAQLSSKVNIQSQGGVFVATSSVNVSSQSYVFTAGGSDIYLAGNVNTLTCSTTPPLSVDTSANSNNIFQDLITRNGAQILSSENSGYLSVGPFVDICGGRIRSATGTLTVVGDLTATGSITASGSCCASDRNVKKNIKRQKPRHFLKMLRKMRKMLVQFDWTDEFLEEDKLARERPSGIYGMIAQEVETVFPQAIRRVEKQVGKKRYNEFLLLEMQRLVPLLMGSVLAQDEEIRHLKRAVKHLIKNKR